jgi:sugar (pentulose or hexulose) kinase/phosphoglycerate dehydrogenase-like enzyme/ribulose-5-phosphate 4-epimerase/fuculose-1-phosphate aldolase
VSQRFVVGVDLGGGGIRCLLHDLESGTTALSARPWSFTIPSAIATGLELDLEQTWHALADAVREACARAGATPDAVAGIAATSMRHATVLLDEAGDVVLATPNRDARGALPMLAAAARHGDVIQQRTGHWPNSIMPAARLLWLAQEQPDRLARATTHLSLSDWVAYRLCGERSTERTQAAETPFIDLETGTWAEDLIEELGLPPQLFPALRSAGEPLGGLLPEAAAALGLTPGTPVAVAGGDTQCGLLGAGVVAPGALGIVAGTSAPLQRVTEHPVGDPRLWTSYHVVPGRFVLESNAGGVGEALDWMAGLLFPDVDHPVVHLLDAASRSEPGANGVRSTFGAQPMNARELSLPVGEIALSPLLAAEDPDRRRHLARAVLEGLVYGLRANADQIAAVSGALPETVQVGGGLARSAFAMQLLADVLGRTVEVPAQTQTTCFGAAICAAVGAGIFPDLESAAGAMLRSPQRHEPRAPSRDAYPALYTEWCELRAQRAEPGAQYAGIAMRHVIPEVAANRDAAERFRPRILVAADLDEASLADLRDLGEVEYASFRQAMRMLTGAALVEALRGVHVFVTEIDVVDAESLLGCEDLRAIVCCRGDAVNVDIEAATALGIPVLHTPGRNADAVADLALGFMLMLARKLAPANAFLREPGGRAGDMARMGKAFGTLQGRELWHKTVGLVGMGAVGRKVVQRLRPFGARCLVYDPYLAPDAARLAGAEPVDLDELLAASDFVTLHAAVTDASRGLIGERELARMQPGSFLVNTARAALIDEDALLASLEAGHLGGAALDVFSEEPPGADHPLLARDDVVATPHIGGNTSDVAAHQGRIVVAELERLLRGEAPRHALNPATLEGFSIGRPRPKPAPAVRAGIGRGPGPAVTDLQKGKQKPAAPRKVPTAPASPRVASGEVAAVRERFERVLRAFLAGILADEKMRDFARGADDVTLHFHVSDLDLEFHLGFGAAGLTAELGAPAEAAPVELVLRADLLDGMFTGRRNAMQAAMHGELSFSGDAAKAMTLNQLEADLSRIYGAARRDVGDPGDLAALPDPSRPASEPAPATRGAPAGSDDVRRELVAVVDELFHAQLITATGGNVSVRVPDAPDEAWITPSQLFKGDLGPEALVRIGMDGRSLAPGGRSPSSEALMHTSVMKARPEVQAVIHCHAPNATVLANTGLPFLPISTEAAFLRDIGRIPFVMPGTEALAQAVVEAIGEGWAVLMQNHGLLVAGRSLRRAADMAEIIERTCEVILGCHAVGVEPPVLPEETVETLAKLGDLMA